MRFFPCLLVCLSFSSIALASSIPVPTPAPRESNTGNPTMPAPAPVPDARPKQDTPTTKQAEPPAGDQPGGPEDNAARESKLSIAPDATANPACETELKKLGVTYTKLEAIRGEGGCSIPEPFQIIEIAPGVRVEPATQLRCEAVLAMARWTQTMILPAVEALGVSTYGGKAQTGVNLKAIRHASTYACRLRNNQSTGKVSEHAIGAAIDIAAFVFDRRDDITMTPRAGDGTREEAFQRSVRASACQYFTTVLGPGSDAFHVDHMHLDIAERRREFRLCQ